MRFGMLGPLEVWDGDERLSLGGPQQRALFAVLLLNANAVVSADRLIDHLWGERPPDSARRLLKGCIAGLRKALRVGRTDRLLTRPPGYLLEVRPGERDLDRFDELAEAAGNVPDNPSVQAAALREALACWRGPALDGLDSAACRAEAARLDERRLSVLEERVDLDLRLGRCAELAAELQALVRQHPLRERLWAQLMLALHGAGRQSDALAVYQRIRRNLVEQLGVEPGATLRQAHRVVLAGTPEPAPRPAARTRARPVPAQLPAEVAAFTARDAELAKLTRLLTTPRSAAVPIVAVLGTAGVGKTAFTLRWAHSVRDRFPDGQLYVNLRGYDPGPPLPASAALGGFLTALGVSGADLPGDADGRAARFRTEVAGRRLLVVLDNAASVEQVGPLLPGTSSCAVVVTSRNTLPGLVVLHGARRLELTPLPAEDARTLLRTLIGERVDEDPPAAAALAAHCARLPLALRVAAELATAHPDEKLAELAGALDDERLRLDHLAAGGDPRAGVRAAFSWSYRRLPPAAARAFRLAARHPELDAETLAALTGGGACAARRTLDVLAGEHLIEAGGHGRYVMHSLLRDYAATLADAEEPFPPVAHHPATRVPQRGTAAAEAAQPRRNHDHDSRSVPA
ncbi:hypothetical protein GCM10027258_70350 [Amycolatopsis stemonae]